MFTVCINVARIVDEVGRTRDEAERDEGPDGGDEDVSLKNRPRSERGCEDEDVLQRQLSPLTSVPK